MKFNAAVLIICATLAAASKRDVILEDIPENEIEEVRVVAGYDASLPCRVMTPSDDKPTITLWYSSHRETPVYSYDERPINNTHWFDPSIFGKRARYHSDWTPPALLLGAARPSDAGIYRCRVDYQHSNTRQSWVQLHVVVPPERVEIYPRESPVLLRQKNDVICKAIGGFPTPRVVWLQNEVIVDSNYTETDTGDAFNSLDVPASRVDLTSPFKCRALNNDLIKPDDGVYLRNVTIGPLSVSILPPSEPFSENRQTRLQCLVVGSNPPAMVSWYSEKLPEVQLDAKVMETDNQTRSILTLNITRDSHKQRLKCRAKNPLMEQAMEDSLELNVNYKPDVKLKLGRTLDPTNLQEGYDVFFECLVNANPPPYKVTWYHQGIPLAQDKAGGVLVSESTLVLQKVSRSAAGNYTCRASNVEGDTDSNTIGVAIRYAPLCAVAPSLSGVILMESVNISCKVDADPPDVTFQWTFNNSARRDQTEVMMPTSFSTEGLLSVFRYSPESERDYGTLLCYAENVVGRQSEPCSFTVISAGPPEEVTRCAVENVTSHSSSVGCVPGFNGGLRQKFWLRLWDKNSHKEVLNMTESFPEFSVKGLQPGHEYEGSVMAFNSRGESPSFVFAVTTNEDVPVSKSLPSRKPPFPTTLLLGITSGFLLVLFILMVVMWVIRSRRANPHHLHHTMSGGGSSVLNRIVGSGGLGMSKHGNIKVPGSKLEVSDIQRLDKEEKGQVRRQPDPDILKSGTSLGSINHHSPGSTPSTRPSPLLPTMGQPQGDLMDSLNDVTGRFDYRGSSPLSDLCRNSVGDIMSGGDLVRRPVTGDLLRSPDLTVVDDFNRASPNQRSFGVTIKPKVLDGYSTVGRKISPSNNILMARLRSSELLPMDDFDLETSGCYRTLAGSPIIEQHLMSGRDSIL